MTSDFSIASTESTASFDQRWMASNHGLDAGKTGTVVLSVAVKAVVNANGFIPSGVAIAELIAGANIGKYDLFDSTAIDGRQILAGFVLADVHVKNADGSYQASGFAPIARLTHAIINRSFLPVVAQRTTISHATESRGAFIFND